MSPPLAAGVVLCVFACLIIPLLIAPLVWHAKSRNISAAFLIVWVLICNLINLVNFLLWPNDDFRGRFNGEVFCDIESKIIVGRSTAIAAATLCILKGLADVMDANKVNLAPSRAQRIRKRAIELGCCIGLPFISMILHFIVQPNRYVIVGISGCVPTFDNSWPTIVLINIPPFIITLVAAYYCCLIIHRLRKYRTAFAGMLTASGTSRARFLRLLILALTFIFVLIPTQAYLLYVNFPAVSLPFVWSVTHSRRAWAVLEFIPSHGQALQDRWISLGCGILVFLALGLGQEARSTYRSWMLAVGLGKVFPSLSAVAESNLPAPNVSAATADTNTSGSGWGSSKLSSLGSKARLFVSPKRWSKAYSQSSWGSSSLTTSGKGDDQHVELASPVEDEREGKDVEKGFKIVKDVRISRSEEKMEKDRVDLAWP